MSGLSIGLIVYGLLNIVLGVLGATAGSMVSLYAAGGAGVVAIVAGLAAKSKPAIGYGLGALVCVALLGRFLPKLLSDPQVYPGGIVVVASAIMLVALVAGHFAKKA